MTKRPKDAALHQSDVVELALAAFTRHQYAERVLDVDLWIVSARELLEAAAAVEVKVLEFWKGARRRHREVLHGRPQVPSPAFASHGVYLMLMGMAFENLFKARLATIVPAGEKEQMAARGTLGRFRTHDLPRLAETTAFSLEREAGDVELLARLTNFVVWRGRYPVAAESHDQLDPVTRDLGMISSPMDIPAVRRLARRIWKWAAPGEEPLGSLDGDHEPWPTGE